MATITSTQTGNWSSTSTWAGGVVPVDGDSVVIATGHTVTFDVDQSSFTTGLAGISINGVLTASTSSGDYYLKLDGVLNHNLTIYNGGILSAGSSGTPYPTTCKFTINLNGLSTITANSDDNTQIKLYCASPTLRYTRANGATSSGATSIPVHDNLTTDIWTTVTGSQIRYDVEGVSTLATISSITSTNILVTSPTTVNIDDNSSIVLVTRNIRIIGYTGGGSAVGFGSAVGSTYFIRCEIQGNNTNGVLISDLYNATIDGVLHSGNVAYGNNYSSIFQGVISGCILGVYPNGGCFSLIKSALISGCNIGASRGYYNIDVNTLITQCAVGIGSGTLMTDMYGTINYCLAGVVSGCIKLHNTAILSNNSVDIINQHSAGFIQGYNATLNSAVQVENNYKNTNIIAPNNIYNNGGVFLWDINGATGSLKAWTAGGRIITDPTTIPPNTTFNNTFNLMCENNNNPIFLDQELFFDKNIPMEILIWIKKDTNSMTATPTVVLCNPGGIVLNSDEIISSITMNDDTNWQQWNIKYTAPYNRKLILRFKAINSTGNIWFNYYVTPVISHVRNRVGTRPLSV